MSRFNTPLFQALACLFLIAFSGLALIAAMWGGIVRMGWDFPAGRSGLAGMHGPLIVCGFLGTFFSLERAVSSGRAIGYIPALLNILGAVALLTQPLSDLSPLFVVAGSVWLFALCLFLLKKEFTLFNFFLCAGSLQWLIGNLIWFNGWPVYNVTLWWMSFVLFMTVGQRLEITQMMHLTVRHWAFLLLALGAVFAGHVHMMIGHLISPEIMDIQLDSIVDPRIKAGMRVAGMGMMLASAWFLWFDPARNRFRQPGMAGYISVCLLSAYFWLGLAGVFSFRHAGLVSGMVYDAFIHSFFLGFLFFMIFAHGPILVPSILNANLNMRPYFYIIPLLHHGGLLLRIAGDMMRDLPLRKWGGMINLAVVLYFLATLGFSLIEDNRSKIFKKRAAPDLA